MTGSYQSIEMKILNALQSLRNGEGSLYDIATWCCALFNGQDDYAAEIGIDPADIPDHVNGKFLSEFAIDLGDCLTLLKYFPGREQWNKPLLELLTAAREAISAESSQEPTGRTVRRATLKELDAATKRADDLECQVKHQSSEIAVLREDNAILRAANAELRRRIRSLQSRLDKLERSGRRTPQPVG